MRNTNAYQLILIFAVGLIGTTLLLGMTAEYKTYGIKCNFVGSDGQTIRKEVVITTGNCKPDFHSDIKHISQLIPEDGRFYRNINGINGKNISLWLKYDGEFVLHNCKTLDYSDDLIDFGEITLPNPEVAELNAMLNLSQQDCDLFHGSKEGGKLSSGGSQAPVTSNGKVMSLFGF